jgi:hypothetical protein
MNWRRVLKRYRYKRGSVSWIQCSDAVQPVPEQYHVVECPAIPGIRKPLDELNAIALADVVRAQPREPLDRFVGLILSSL